MKKMLIAFMMIFSVINAEDLIILKSGRKLEGTVVKKDNQFHLIGKYGTIIFNASDVEIVKPNTTLEAISEVSAKVELEETANETLNLVTCQITTKSGRKLIGSIYQKGTDIFLVDLGGVVKIDPFILISKEELGGNKIKGQVISGERCNVILKSGRAFSGVVEEIDGAYFVSTAIGTVKVDKVDLDHIEKTGDIFNLKEAQEKYSENYVAPPVIVVAPVENKNNVSKELTIEEMIQINNKADEAIKKSKEKVKEIPLLHEQF